MDAFYGGLLAWSMMQPSSDPRAISAAANRPEIVGSTDQSTPTTSPGTRSPTTTTPPPVASPRSPARTRSHPPSTTPPRTRPRRLSQQAPEDRPPTCFGQRSLCWRLNVAGIITASIGAGMIGSGVGLMQAPEYPDPDDPIVNRSLRPPGIALIATGAVTVATGVLLVVLGHIDHARSQPRPYARVRLTPQGLQW